MNEKVKLNTTRSKITNDGDAWILHVPRFGEEGQHYHTYGMLTPYFKGLPEGKLMGTRCTNRACPISNGNGELWLPPRADCPDCHQPMEWEQAPELEGYIYAYTYVERGGTGLEIECPYYQVDVKLPGVGTIVKSYLLDRQAVKIGDRVRVKFRTAEEATNTSLDMYFELV
jgi:uncharacterized OB-fold protein